MTMGSAACAGFGAKAMPNIIAVIATIAAMQYLFFMVFPPPFYYLLLFFPSAAEGFRVSSAERLHL
jgi:hypothetical protein